MQAKLKDPDNIISDATVGSLAMSGSSLAQNEIRQLREQTLQGKSQSSSLVGNAEFIGGKMSQRAVLLAAWADIPVAETEEIYPTAETGDDFALAFIKTVSRSASSMSKPFGWGVSSERAPRLVSLPAPLARLFRDGAWQYHSRHL
jgi:hypothetical protein